VTHHEENEMLRVVSLVLGLTLFPAQNLWAQSAGPVLDPAYGLANYVSGQALADSGRIVVYDTFYPARTKLGEDIVDANGRFWVFVKVPLQEGHSIVVEDSLQRISPPVTVQEPGNAPSTAQ
jgi:hypothetical protein